MIAIALMTAGSFLIGVTPTYDQIGILAPLILLLARLAQGISSGGEWPAAAAYLMEIAPKKRKSLYGSLFSVTTCAGAFTASLLGGSLTGALGADAMASWGWRIPFLVGGLFGVILLVLRRQLAETEVFQREASTRASRGSLREVLVTYRRQVLLSVLFISGMATVGGTWTSVIPATGQRIAAPGLMFWVVVCATSILMVVNVPIGLLADKVGPRRFLLGASVLFAITGSYTFLTIEGTFTSLLLTYLSGTVYLVCATTTLPGILSELFPAEHRATGPRPPQRGHLGRTRRHRPAAGHLPRRPRRLRLVRRRRDGLGPPLPPGGPPGPAHPTAPGPGPEPELPDPHEVTKEAPPKTRAGLFSLSSQAGRLLFPSSHRVSDSSRCDPVVPTCLESIFAPFLNTCTSAIPCPRPRP
ncbi:hypothetical protein GCM10020254_85540 [Streptomyces goshikiensis]